VALFGRFFGRTIGEGAGVAIGTATANVVEPALQELANAAKEQYPHYPLEPEDAAAARAREPVEDIDGLPLHGVDPSHEARYGGMRQARFDVLTELQREHPSVGELLDLRRRRLALGGDHGIGQAEFQEWLRRTGYSADIIRALTKLLTHFLAPADIANAVQQGFVPGEDLLPPPETGDPPFEPPTEVVDIDAVGEAGVAGVDRNRLKVLAELSGNPPGLMELLEMWRRNIITERAVERGIREGRLKTKWTPALKLLARLLLPPSVLVNLRLRGWIEADEFHTRMQPHGYNAAQADDWFKSSGRPMAPQQAFDAIARGAPGPFGGTFDFGDFETAIRQSDIRPEWVEPLKKLYYKYPPLFQLRRAVESGGITPARAREIMHIERYEPDDIDGLIQSWVAAGGTTSKGLTVSDLANEYEARWLTRTQYIAALRELGYSADNAAAKADAEDARRARAARNRRVELIGQRYVKHALSRDQAVAELTASEVPARVRDSLMPEWDAMRSITPDALTSAQIKKAFAKAQITRAEAVARLLAKGYEEADANIYLDQ
jgi:hypothetical protein